MINDMSFVEIGGFAEKKTERALNWSIYKLGHPTLESFFIQVEAMWNKFSTERNCHLLNYNLKQIFL